jgi:hypothetical protein
LNVVAAAMASLFAEHLKIRCTLAARGDQDGRPT